MFDLNSKLLLVERNIKKKELKKMRPLEISDDVTWLFFFVK